MKTIFSLVFLTFSLTAFAELPEFCRSRVEEVAKDFKQYKDINCEEEASPDVLFMKEMKVGLVENIGRDCEMEVIAGKHLSSSEMHLSTDIYSIDFKKEAIGYFETLIK